MTSMPLRMNARLAAACVLFGVTMAHAFDAVGSARLAFRHRDEIAIDPVGRDAQFLAHGAIGVGTTREGAGDEIEAAVEARGVPVRGSDAGARPAAHHSQSQWSHFVLSLAKAHGERLEIAEARDVRLPPAQRRRHA